jgi:hypothetical protein
MFACAVKMFMWSEPGGVSGQSAQSKRAPATRLSHCGAKAVLKGGWDA